MIRVAVFLMVSASCAWACDEAGTRLVPESDGVPDVFVVFGDVPLSQPFSLQVTVCDQAQINGLRVDAIMPAHQHGMNYTTDVTRMGDRAFAVDGMVFHMPGMWQLRVDVDYPDKSVRYTHDVTLK